MYKTWAQLPVFLSRFATLAPLPGKRMITGMHQERLLDAAQFIEANLFADIRAADIASAVWTSERSLQRHFSGMVGESLASFVRGRRLTRAAERLHQGEPVDRLSVDLSARGTAMSRAMNTGTDTGTETDIDTTSRGADSGVSWCAHVLWAHALR